MRRAESHFIRNVAILIAAYVTMVASGWVLEGVGVAVIMAILGVLLVAPIFVFFVIYEEEQEELAADGRPRR
jgi:uncharacterized membrane protein